jgi:hypothetical protein
MHEPLATWLFIAGNACVVPFWGAMLLPRGTGFAERWLRSPWICAPFAVVYLVLFVASLPDMIGALEAPGFGSVVKLIGTPLGTNWAWFHYLTCDLLVGRWIYWDSRRRAIARPWLWLVFLLGLTFCPLGLLLYLVLTAGAPPLAEQEPHV